MAKSLKYYGAYLRRQRREQAIYPQLAEQFKRLAGE